MYQDTTVLPSDGRYPRTRLITWFDPLPALYFVGNLNLLDLSLTALFCSRKCPGGAILHAYDQAQELRKNQNPVIGGFHTPVEKDMLEILLKGKGAIVICQARGLEGMRIPVSYRKRIEQGSLLLISNLPLNFNRITKQSAQQRNKLVMSLAEHVQVIYAFPGGEVEKLLENRKQLLNRESRMLQE